MILRSEEETAVLGVALARAARGGDVITLSGPLGAGKTALARGMIAALGHEGEVPSPSFAIVQPYEGIEPPVWHVDLYRIEDAAEIAELGLDATADAVLLVEWPERAGTAAWPDALGLSLNVAPNGDRILTAKVPPVMGGAMAAPMRPPEHAPEFLAASGWAGAEILPLAGDASFRRYFRVVHGERSAVLMDAPPPHEDPRPFVAVSEWLVGAGLSAPEILARDLERGLLLLGDFGNDRLRERLDDDPARETELYELATDLLVQLHRHPPMAGLKPHGLDEWLDEVALFTDWYCPAVGADVDAEAYRAAWGAVLGPVAADGLGPVTVLRDYHAENIMLVGGRSGVAHLGLLDFQDALAGHPAYDLASVLEDARRDVPPAVERAMIDRYTAATGGGEAFERAYWALAAQRNTRILGVFTRLWKRDGKPGYRRFQPRMWGLLERDLAQPHLQPVRDWFDANIAPEHRREPWREAA